MFLERVQGVAEFVEELLALLPLPPGEGWGEGIPAFISAAALLFALAIDRCFGEPPARWHPVAWIGRYLGRASQCFAPRIDSFPRAAAIAFAAGAIAWCVGAAAVALAALALEALARRLPWPVAAVLLGIALKPMLSWRMLQGEVLAVETALAESIDAGRSRLARLVSRDVHALGEVEVRESAIESLAENLNDSVVAPVFWFVLFGLPGAAIYRFANTADAMWGYRGVRDGRDWQWAGKWAARADDVLSWLPARLTALMLLLSFSLPFRVRAAVGATTCREADRTPSPNSGWPMAAMALGLGVRLGKPGVYTLNATGRKAVAADTQHAVRLAARVVVLLAASAPVAILALAA